MKTMRKEASTDGLEILAAMGDLKHSWSQPKRSPWLYDLGYIRVSFVVGAMGGEGRQEQLALGESKRVFSHPGVGNNPMLL